MRKAFITLTMELVMLCRSTRQFIHARFCYTWPAALRLSGIMFLFYVLHRFNHSHVAGNFIAALNQTFEKQYRADGKVMINSGKPLWSYLLSSPAVGALFGGYVLLITFAVTHRQKEQHTQEERFEKVKGNFADENPKTRARAASDLAKMGQIRRPGAPRTVTSKTHLFFKPAAELLSAALYKEEDPYVYKQMKEALHALTDFAKGRPGEDLLKYLIQELAKANREALTRGVLAVAEYSRGNLHSVSYYEVSEVVSIYFKQTEYVEYISLYLMMRPETKEIQAEYAVLRRGAKAAETYSDREASLKEIQISMYWLKNTRDMLADALKACRYFSWPGNVVDVSGCFLVAADLTGAQLHRAKLSGVQLQGALLYGIQLYKAELIGADLQGADLRSAQFQGAKLRGANVPKEYDVLLSKKQLEQVEETRLFMQSLGKSEEPFRS